jgi:hypothetical protein
MHRLREIVFKFCRIIKAVDLIFKAPNSVELLFVIVYDSNQKTPSRDIWFVIKHNGGSQSPPATSVSEFRISNNA